MCARNKHSGDGLAIRSVRSWSHASLDFLHRVLNTESTAAFSLRTTNTGAGFHSVKHA
jgi:hypothetical protein